MWVSVDLCVVPIGVSLSSCEKVIRAAGLIHHRIPMARRLKALGMR